MPPAYADTVYTEPACQPATARQIENLFDEWNQAVQSGEPQRVVALYADRSTLLATLSAEPRITRQQKIDYFEKFLLLKPVARLDTASVRIDCHMAFNTGLYTFTLGDGKSIQARYTFTYANDQGGWLITSHHSSLMPTLP
ncbi:SgcJ/EcaC family oxidoreductase [Xylophilus sp. Kf1]|nr:SgcJ/EcaC family oxidoreductase [Xylophilus sp. Kf1]